MVKCALIVWAGMMQILIKNKMIIIIRAYYEISQGGSYTFGTVERLDGAKMSIQVPLEASDGSQVIEGERKGVPDR